jgi:hypothetical protein
MDLPAYAGQAALTSGFWMSFHELTNGYPWLTKRTVRVSLSLRPLRRLRGSVAPSPVPMVARLGRLRKSRFRFLAQLSRRSIAPHDFVCDCGSTVTKTLDK